MPKPVATVERSNAVAGVDPLGELIKNLFDVCQKLIELSWDGMKFWILNLQ